MSLVANHKDGTGTRRQQTSRMKTRTKPETKKENERIKTWKLISI
jgi:hypothetical protein